MAIMQKYVLEKEYVQIPNETATAVEVKHGGQLSLQALGLITNLWSYDVSKWEIHKTELYKRYGKNKETSVKNAWSELVDGNYIIEFRFRNNGRWDYVYYYNVKPFPSEIKEKILLESADKYGEISTLDFQDLKNKTSKTRPQNQEIINTISKKDSINEKQIKEIKTLDLRPIDDIYNLQLPMPLKKWLGSKIDLLKKSQIDLLELEEFYNICEYLKHDNLKYDDFLNDFEFTYLVKKLVSNVVIKKSTQGILLQWVLNKLHYKQNEVLPFCNDNEELDFYNNPIADIILNRHTN